MIFLNFFYRVATNDTLVFACSNFTGIAEIHLLNFSVIFHFDTPKSMEKSQKKNIQKFSSHEIHYYIYLSLSLLKQDQYSISINCNLFMQNNAPTHVINREREPEKNKIFADSIF